MLVMVVFFIAFRWIHLSTPLIRLFLLVLILLLMPTLNFLPVWFALSLLRFRLPSRLPMMFILWMVAMMLVIIPSSRPARAAAGRPVAGRDDRAGPPDSAGGGGWQRGTAGGALRCDKPSCNSTVRGRSAYKSRTPSGIPGCDKLAAGEVLLREPPSAHAGGL